MLISMNEKEDGIVCVLRSNLATRNLMFRLIVLFHLLLESMDLRICCRDDIVRDCDTAHCKNVGGSERIVVLNSQEVDLVWTNEEPCDT